MSYSVRRHRVVTNESLLHFHLNNVDCYGNENVLSDCYHGRVGVHDCVAQSEEAGVICNGRLFMP